MNIVVLNKYKFPILFFILILFIFLVIFAIYNNYGLLVKNYSHKNELDSLWNNAKYWELINVTEKYLLDEPLNAFYLNYNAIAYLAVSFSVPDNDERAANVDKAISRLRKVMLFTNNAKDRIVLSYLLGKAYFLKGEYYTDLAKSLLLFSYEEGYQPKDLIQYLGLIYAEENNFEESNKFLEQAYSITKDPVLALSISKNYFNIKEFDLAMDIVNTILDLPELEEDFFWDAMFLKGKILYEIEKYEEAEKVFNKMIKNTKYNAMAYFFLGNISLNRGDKVKARALYRNALKYDSDNSDIISKLKETYGGF